MSKLVMENNFINDKKHPELQNRTSLITGPKSAVMKRLRLTSLSGNAGMIRPYAPLPQRQRLQDDRPRGRN